jgi:hypothetical protein
VNFDILSFDKFAFDKKRSTKRKSLDTPFQRLKMDRIKKANEEKTGKSLKHENVPEAKKDQSFALRLNQA